MNPLAQRIRAAAPRLGERLFAEMYRDPFWEARYGARGRRHSRQDADYHLGYLAESLEANDPGVLVRYARWLRTVLVSRGMCTGHLAESFHLLARYLGEEGWPDGRPAVDGLLAAADALLYDAGPARMVQEDARRMAAAAGAGKGEAERVQLERLLSYLADSMEACRPELLLEHVRWIGGAGLLGMPVEEALQRLAEQIEGLESHTANVAQSYLAAARPA